MNEMDNLDFKNYFTSEKLFKKHYELRDRAISYLMEFSNMNIPSNTFLDNIQNLDKKINDEFINIYMSKWEEICKRQCVDLYIKLIEEYKKVLN